MRIYLLSAIQPELVPAEKTIGGRSLGGEFILGCGRLELLKLQLIMQSRRPLRALIGAFDLDCTDDEAARERVREVLDSRGAELWRRVALFEPDGPSIQPSHEELVGFERSRTRRRKRRAKSRE